MTTAVAVNSEKKLARPLKVLVPLIRNDITRGDAAGMEFYIRAGEKLIEAKAQFKHGGWEDWSTKTFNKSGSTMRRWMAAAFKTGAGARFETLSEVSHPNRASHHRPDWHTPVSKYLPRVDIGKLVERVRDADKERKLLHELGHQLIDIGFKVLATKLHPDKGGSREAMVRLNEVRVILKRAI